MHSLVQERCGIETARDLNVYRDSSWDESVPEIIGERWQAFRQNLYALEGMKFPRTIANGSENLELHGFCNASERAYGACIYIKTTGLKPIVRLICAKSRVAPLKTQSLPRLELCGAVILARLYRSAKNALRRIHFRRSIFWSDSTIVLNWIHTPLHTLKTFIAHRVAEITEIAAPEQWRHISTNHNPADLISCGVTSIELIESELWRSGPSWLIQSESCWPPNILEKIEIPEIKKVISLATSNSLPDVFIRYSSISKLKHVVAYCLRFAHNTKRSIGDRFTGELSVDELKTAEITILKVIQGKSFADIIKQITTGKDILTPLIALNPFLDKQGILRVGGRLARSNLPYKQKHSVLLPKGHFITDAIIRENHEKIYHGGTQATLNAVRERFWPINGRASVKRVIDKCIICKRLKAIMPSYRMSDLPANRLQQMRPFLHTGVDFCGPVFLKEKQYRNRGRIKAYVAIFVCFSTKAVHLELASDLTTETFLAALRRFMARRGKSSDIYSNNATNFVGAANVLQDRVSRKLSDEGIRWHFIFPRSPHFGGIWEAAVKSFKHHLIRVIGETLLTYEAMQTYVLEIEAILNSRPLTPLSDDPNDLRTLTPGHFLIGDSLTSLPEHDHRDLPCNRLSHWQQIQQMRQHF
ncbi:uncharacterized protein LOC122517844 [Polistes fuscatus]|uniref:uncharacterized protein LOC122517844 n=1 Tax=Polistes fuscatus TaxID=30207 RepID=UPI001CA97EEC|nr:uncharacterized protein LOC122517844 [Polistes fuscatus]